MDDKTFIAAYTAQETQRINERLKKMVSNPTPPTEEEREEIAKDISATLARLQSALSHIHAELEKEGDVKPS